MLRMLNRPSGLTRWIAATLVLAVTATLWPATAWASAGHRTNKTEKQIADAVEISVNRGDLLMIHMRKQEDSSTWEFWWTDGTEVTWIGTTPTRMPGGQRKH